ncbi:ATP-dependent helicase Lhr and Lhr-like helicase [Micromonospora haikouensis]|uniref:ATP-dependent helicase Lhr and Lhr-like helicase n=1 Tax=Micromonospora haikouensis TaxID=686309 RepID=A0A1C4VHB3_9ACTN|nr:ATP-dependent helicase Lhr and Lhr-like helicase [Micromonospora haikouensis]
MTGPHPAEPASAADRLHPVLLHHIVNTLGWPRLRGLQERAVIPLLAGDDALLLAATASGKTEAALFPVLSRMAAGNWSGTSVLYVCPLKALLNNLAPRLTQYTSWLGRRCAVWHGDTTTAVRQRILRERPDVLLTTPESIESMLVSRTVDHAALFAGLRVVVVDEVHAFAGDDRGWHLLAVLERLTRLVGRPLQRIGLSATVGNPVDLLTWLQGAAAGHRPARVVSVDRPGTIEPATPAHSGVVELDYVGSWENAATVIASLHPGEKRLVFCESRQGVEQLGQLLLGRGVTTFLSHASLSRQERARAEQAFAEARDCVIVSTSTLELGIDVGDLDRVIQIDAPQTVASFLQRLGRSGRRAGTSRNCLLLTLGEPALLQAAGLLLLWARGWVEPVAAPPEPRHIVAQQILALCLQEGQVGDREWRRWWNGLAPYDKAAEDILRFLLAEGYLERDGGMLFIGPAAERRFGHRHFMEMLSVFTAPPQFTVLAGRAEIGRVDPALLTEETTGPRRLLLAGRSWRVTHLDWSRRRCFVEPADEGGRARWTGSGAGGLSFALCQAMREVVLGATPPVSLTRRAASRLAEIRAQHRDNAHPEATVVTRPAGGGIRWWTWAGYRANATLASTLREVADPVQGHGDLYVRLRDDLTAARWRDVREAVADRIRLPEVDSRALAGLKFSAALPPALAGATLSARLADLRGAREVLSRPARFTAG